MKITVIIPVYNAENTISQCVDSVLANDHDDFEIVVVDDCSSDRSLEIVEKKISDKRLRLLRLNVNSGPAPSRNAGIRASEGSVVLFLDSDSYVEKDWIRRHATLHEKIEAAIVGGAISSVCHTAFGRSDGFCNWWTSIPYSEDGYVQKFHLPTNNLSVRKAAFEKIGYLDETLRSGEDAEFFFRAHKDKLKVYFKSDLIVYHYEKDTLGGFLKHQAKWGEQFFKMRKKRKMEYYFLVPNSYFMMCLYAIPLAIVMTLFIALKWVRYRPSVLFFIPLIFLGKCSHIASMRGAFVESKGE